MQRQNQSVPERTLDARGSSRKARHAAPDPEAESRFESEGGRQADEPELRLFGDARPFAHRGEQSDDDVRFDVSRCLAEGFLDAIGIEVSVNRGVVTLDGTVNDPLRRQFAEDIARTRHGVTSVNNKLRVRKK